MSQEKITYYPTDDGDTVYTREVSSIPDPGKWGEIMGAGYQPNTVNGVPDGSLSDGNLDKWRAVEISYKYNTTTQISVLYGSQKGGLVCANGICAVQPGFEDGFKVTFRSLF